MASKTDGDHFYGISFRCGSAIEGPGGENKLEQIS